MIFTDTEADMFWFSCILATTITGAAMVFYAKQKLFINIGEELYGF